MECYGSWEVTSHETHETRGIDQFYLDGHFLTMADKPEHISTQETSHWSQKGPREPQVSTPRSQVVSCFASVQGGDWKQMLS